MNSMIISFFASLLFTLFIIRFDHLHRHMTADFDLSGPQKFHTTSTPRIGGAGIFLGLVVAAFLGYFFGDDEKTKALITLIGCGIPAFGIGFAEDITKKVSVKARLLGTSIAAGVAGVMMHSWIGSVGIWPIDYLLAFPIVSVIFSCFAVAGLANAYNMIDGFNGLSSMVAMITLMAIAYVGFKVSDPLIPLLAFVMVGAIAGFFMWNYPKGHIFLGDGGAYLIGFWVAILSILLTVRNDQVSPWFSLIVNIYPIFETLFTIWRRKIFQGKNPGLPDGFHFHTLIYRRVVKWAHLNEETREFSYKANASTSPYLWLLSTLGVIPAILWWNKTSVLMAAGLVFALTYMVIYRRIVCFKKIWALFP